MRIAVGQFNELTDEKLRYAAQIGVGGIQLNTPIIPGDTHWQEQDLRMLVERCKEYGLVFEAIENVPLHFYDKAMLGLPGRDEQIEHYCTTIRNMGTGRHPDPRLPLHAELRLAHATLRAGARRRAASPPSIWPPSRPRRTATQARIPPPSRGRQEAIAAVRRRRRLSSPRSRCGRTTRTS